MKRLGNVTRLAADPDNLRLAFWKAQKGKQGAEDVIAFGNNLDVNLQQLRSEILTGKVQTGGYRHFVIHDPKKREILAAPFSQRVLHHALMNICHPVFERFQIFDSYASRKGKGTYAALERAAFFNQKYQWFLKLDFRKYFYTINHNTLKRQLSRLFKDDTILQIFERIIDSYQTAEKAGLPIGNLTSQYFANHYLAVADHFAKEKLQCPAYVRYMDDIVIWNNDKEKLLAQGQAFDSYCSAELKISLKPFCLNNHAKGLPFLGYLLYRKNIKLAASSRKRFIEKYKHYQSQLDTQQWQQNEYQKHILPLIAFTQHANAKRFRQRVMETM